MNTVLNRLDDYSLRLQLSKCKFIQKSVTTWAASFQRNDFLQPMRKWKLSNMRHAQRTPPSWKLSLERSITMVNSSVIWVHSSSLSTSSFRRTKTWFLFEFVAALPHSMPYISSLSLREGANIVWSYQPPMKHNASRCIRKLLYTPGEGRRGHAF